MEKTIYAPHKIKKENNTHLLKIIEIIKEKGTPTIKVVDCGEYYQAIEGCHRLAGCDFLGIIPEIEIYNYDDNKKVKIQIGNENKKMTVAEACDLANKGERYYYNF